MKSKISASKVRQFYKRFANGEQYIELNPVTGETLNQDKQYYWQEQRVYNEIKPIIKSYCGELSENELYGRNGLVSLLEPWQRMYNDIMNHYHRHLDMVSYGLVLIEDGSIDVDELCEEGLAPGKVLVYRQGSNTPIINHLTLDTEGFLQGANYCLAQMNSIVNIYISDVGFKSAAIK